MGHDGWKEEARSGVKMSESTVVQPPVSEWKDLPWKMIQQRVWKLQKRIFRAAQRGDQRAVHRLEQLLMKSWSAKCLAVRRVTQDNRGKNTAGVDGIKAIGVGTFFR